MYGAGKDGKSERLKLPVESLYWLVDELAKQKSSQDRLSVIPLSQQAQLQDGQGMPPQGPQGMMPQPQAKQYSNGASNTSVWNVRYHSIITCYIVH